jgi:putative addiction module component (TIGR02574 family)
MTTLEKIRSDITKLTPTERAELVDDLLTDLAEPDVALEASWVAEAADRLAAYDRGEIKGITLNELLARRARRKG